MAQDGAPRVQRLAPWLRTTADDRAGTLRAVRSRHRGIAADAATGPPFGLRAMLRVPGAAAPRGRSIGAVMPGVGVGIDDAYVHRCAGVQMATGRRRLSAVYSSSAMPMPINQL